jgi:hypothetical protein
MPSASLLGAAETYACSVSSPCVANGGISGNRRMIVDCHDRDVEVFDASI